MEKEEKDNKTLSFEVLAEENKKLSNKVAELEATINDMRDVIKYSLSNSKDTEGDNGEQEKSNKNELFARLKEVLK